MVYKNDTVLSILENYSHSKHQECILDVTPATKYGYKLSNCENVTNVVESINGDYRCFTYFIKYDLRNSSDPESKINEEILLTSIFKTPRSFERRDNRV